MGDDGAELEVSGDGAGQPSEAGTGVDPFEMAPNYYGGQAVIEGVMMRGAQTWAVAVRRPSGEVWVERHPVSDFPRRHPLFARPMLRGVYALADALSIGMRALSIAAREAIEDEDGEQLPSGAMGASMAVALAVFVGIFIVLPSAGTKLVSGDLLGDGVWFHLVESFVRILIFLGYLYAISFMSDIRRVFQYHGAEHATITAWEHGEVLEPSTVARYSTLHVRCGTNFLIMVMLLAVIVYTLAGQLVPAPDAGLFLVILYHVALRIVLLPVVAGLAYEGLRLGAARGGNPLVRGLMQPGLWLQHITTRVPEPDQIEVAVRAFEAVVPAEQLDGRVPGGLESPVVTPEDEGPGREETRQVDPAHAFEPTDGA